jgi:opacity protein-like surface antigen
MPAHRAAALAMAVLILGAPASARADVFIAPFAAVNFGGDTPKTSATVGGSIGFLGDRAGFEFEFGYAPGFFSTGSGLFETEGNVTTLMANVIIGGPGSDRRGASPYLEFGAGLLRTNVTSPGIFFDDIGINAFGVNVGGGLLVMPAENLSIRADVRYFRSLKEEDDDFLDITLDNFGFWRAGVMLGLHF